MLRKLSISGLRGFATSESLELAVPDGAPGSGLTVLVGANNSGKSTVIEALRAFSAREEISFTQGRRNISAGDQVRLIIEEVSGATHRIESVKPGGSETNRQIAGNGPSIFVVPSRRSFEPFFGKEELDRNTYSRVIGFPAQRSQAIGRFSGRLFRINKDQAKFNEMLAQVLDPLPAWTIDQHDTGSYFLKFAKGDSFHNSEGLGEGLISLMFIIDALYDSQQGQMVVIDEPELSLHPAIVKKLAKLISETAKDRQIVISTHSPYLVDFGDFSSGANICRVYLDGHQSKIRSLSSALRKRVQGLFKDMNNPHVLGTDAKEALFLPDGIILVEGQEDVMFLPRVQASVGVSLEGTLFGYGVGGAEKMEIISTILEDLGYSKVVGVLDANKASFAETLRSNFKNYLYECIPADDVRSKPQVTRPAVEGLLDEKNLAVRDEFREKTKEVFDRINTFMKA